MRTQSPSPIASWQRILLYSKLGIAAAIKIAWADTAGIATDGSMGPAQVLSGVSVTIPQSLGTTAGSNLFHSFSEFNVNTGQTVTFTGSDALQNVISRVTGGAQSNIDGILQSKVGHADFYLINPAGIVFGANAQVNVPGAFHVSTADKIDFQNHSGVLYADKSQSSTLSAAAPADFGFLGISTANNGLIEVNGAQLTVNTGQSMDMVAGNITVKNAAALTSPAGEIRLVAVQKARTVGVERASQGGVLPLPEQIPTAANAGDIRIKNNSLLDASGNGGGHIALWGGDASLVSSNVYADNTGSSDAIPAKGIDIRSHSLTLNNTWITFDALGDGQAGQVAVDSGMLNILNGALIGSSAYAKGNAGSLNITADTLTIDGQGSPYDTGIVSQALEGGEGHAGQMVVNAGAVSILNGALIAGVSPEGDAGSVTVTAETLTIDGQGVPYPTGIHANKVLVNAETLDILNGAVISSSTWSQSDAGSVEVTADNLKIDGQGYPNITGIVSLARQGSGHAGNVLVTSSMLDILNEGVISTSTFAQGNAGSVTVDATTLKIVDGQKNHHATGIFSTAEQGSSGLGGDVTVQAGALQIINKEGGISSTTWSRGEAGNVVVGANTLEIIDGGGISSASRGSHSSGKTGCVNIVANDWIHMANGGSINIKNAANVPDADTALNIVPGIITVTVPDILLENSEIATNSAGNVSAGNIVIHFSHWLSMDPSFISTVANTGNGGSITINGGELIALQNSGFLTSASGASSNGGNINVAASILVMNTGVIQANAIGGAGGDITLNLSSLITSENSLIKGGEQAVAWQPQEDGLNLIQAASATGVSGTVNITAPQLNLSGVLANLGGPQFSAGGISQDYCEVGVNSSLRRSGKGGLPLNSNDLLLF